MSVETSAPRSRRAILAAALGGLGAVIVSRFAAPDPAAGADGDPVLLGGTNQGNHSTQINSLTGETAFVAHSHDGTGLFAESDNSTPSDFSGPSQKTGVIGVGGGGMPVGPSLNTDEIGVYGYCDLTPNSAGVWGDTINGTGVYGTGDYGVYGQGRIGVVGDVNSGSTGILGYSGDGALPNPTDGVAIEAVAGIAAVVALKVRGRVQFSRSGRTRILAGESARKITMDGVTTASYVIATLQTRRTGVYVHAVVPAAGSFTIYLNKAVSAATYIGYLVIN